MKRPLIEIIKEAALAKDFKKRYRRSLSQRKRYRPKVDLAEKNATEVIVNPTSDSKVELPIGPSP